MSQIDSGHTKRLLEAAANGDANAQDAFFDYLYEELRRIARCQPFVGAVGETLQPTALANEAFVAMRDQLSSEAIDSPGGRKVFFTAVGRAMRLILRDHWRSSTAKKRGGAFQKNNLSIDQITDLNPQSFEQIDFVSLDEALDRLAKFNSRWHDVVMHRYFAGRTVEETAAELQIAESTVKADWQLARAWLLAAMERGE